MARTVTTTGYGEASGPYDRATLVLAVAARAASPGDATTRAGYAVSQVRQAVLARGVREHALTTGAVTLSPVHDPWPTVVSYEASFGLRLELDDVEGVGSLLVAAVDAGGDAARVDGVRFGHREPHTLARLARDRAYADALVRAQQYAGLAGQALGEVRRVVEGAASLGGPVRMAAMAVEQEAVPVDGGEGSVRATVTVTWALGPGS